MNFTKMHGTGNDFILIEVNREHDWSQLAKVMCDRHFGIGADGLLLLLPSKTADSQMRMFNPDGSEAEACGNGIRCLAKYVLDEGLLKNSGKDIPDGISVQTMSGVSKLKLQKIGNETRIQADMGIPQFEAKDIPVILQKDTEKIMDIKPMLGYPIAIDGLEMTLNFVSMGNPHAVCFWNQPISDFPLAQIGLRVEHLGLFPNRVNFEIAHVVDNKQIEARIWERGVGETLACGTGACAIAVAAHLHGCVGNIVDIKVPGGILQVEWDGTRKVFLSGSAETVFTGEWKGMV